MNKEKLIVEMRYNYLKNTEAFKGKGKTTLMKFA